MKSRNNDITGTEEGKIRAAFLGPKGTFCEQAALTFFEGKNVSLINCKGINDIFELVEDGNVDYGVVPIENSTEGSVNIALDLLLESKIFISGEVEERITHNLIARSGIDFADIEIVISHPQAIAQCRVFLDKYLPNVQIKEADSTAAAVKVLENMDKAAAIASELAAKTYGTNILKEGIEDNPNNFTRFLVLAKKDSNPTGADRTSILFSVQHIPGALNKALEVFARRRINLTKIESRPTKDKPWEYIFFCDFEGHRTDKKLSEALEELENSTIFLKILGSYPKFSSKG